MTLLPRIVLLLIVAACSQVPTGPLSIRYYDRRPFAPLAQYPAWYQQVEDCLGQTGSYEEVEWFLADSIIADNGRRWGYTEFPNSITLQAGVERIQTRVKHEMVHHVTQMGDELHGVDGSLFCEF